MLVDKHRADFISHLVLVPPAHQCTQQQPNQTDERMHDVVEGPTGHVCVFGVAVIRVGVSVVVAQNHKEGNDGFNERAQSPSYRIQEADEDAFHGVRCLSKDELKAGNGCDHVSNVIDS